MGMATGGKDDGCPTCGATPQKRGELKALRAFAQAVLEGSYGPTLMEAQAMKASDLVVAIDNALRDRAKAALQGPYHE